MKKIIILLLCCTYFATSHAQVSKLLATAKPIQKDMVITEPAAQTLKVNTAWISVTDKALVSWLAKQENVDNDLEKLNIKIAGKATLADKRQVVYYTIMAELPGEGTKHFLYALIVKNGAVVANNELTNVGMAYPFNETPTCGEKKYTIAKTGNYKVQVKCSGDGLSKNVVINFAFDADTNLPLQLTE